ncbi:hypothetical protein BS47DRAFT_705839 [Hydnum rufescens UP504]|uniref:Uncharacterized protein n=1 Tax=Hydnum rufescens UP504 TaxID=1448309 RepID=A0A9P6B2E7_9AGAM|nr:hypothetical protein BS47DRAFT_705839 [Hydnum rufescens UP504]
MLRRHSRASAKMGRHPTCNWNNPSATLYLLNTALTPFRSNDHPLDAVLHEKYLTNLYRTISSTPRYRCSEDDFVNLVLKTMKPAAVEPVWSAMALDYLFKHISDPFARLKLFDAILPSFYGNPRNSTQIQRWCSQIIEIDLALPPDDAFEEATAWIDALRSTAICFLDVVEWEGTADLFPGAISFATHVLARCDGWRVATLIAKMNRVSRPWTSDGPSHFRPLLVILDDFYFFESVRDYAQVLRQADALFDLEVLFLTNVVAHVEAHSEPTDEDPDPEPLLDDLQLEAVSNWLAEAEDRLAQLRQGNEHTGTPRYQPATPPRRHSPRKPQAKNGKRGAKSARPMVPTQSLALRPAKRTRTANRFTSPPIETPMSPVPSSPFRGAAHFHSKENRGTSFRSAYITPPKPRPSVYSKESKSERPVTPRPERKSSRPRTSILVGHPRSLKHPNVPDMEEDSSDSEKTASSEPDPLDLFATASPPRVPRTRR